MSFFEVLKKLEESKDFKNWKKDENFLAYGFIMIGDDIKEEWQIGYFNPNNTVTVFVIGDTIIKNPESDIFQEGNVKRLEIEKVKIDFPEAMEKSDDLQKSKYPEYKPYQKMVILQNMSMGNVWNITFMSKTLKVLNIKIDAISGEIVKDEVIELFKFSK
ncbi:MAG: hypothetical protein NDI94_01745 [Candidatus Woesearchaeota archaeon]|nr:hypothetical protein [Candidatus Woesearchaeota archaeon]